jgi:hypothetical protein
MAEVKQEAEALIPKFQLKQVLKQGTPNHLSTQNHFRSRPYQMKEDVEAVS